MKLIPFLEFLFVTWPWIYQNEKVPFERVKAVLGQQFTSIVLILIQKHTLLRLYVQKWLKNFKNNFFRKLRPKKCLWSIFVALSLILWAIFKIPFLNDRSWKDAPHTKKISLLAPSGAEILGGGAESAPPCHTQQPRGW